MQYFCATVKVMVADEDVNSALKTLQESFDFLRDEQNCITDWGFCLEVPSGKGPGPRLIDPKVGAHYEQGVDDLKGMFKNSPEAQALEEELEATFIKL